MITVAQITDTHLFADENTLWKDINPDLTLNQIITKIKKFDPLPDVILLTGDLSQDETLASYQRLYDKIQSLNIPTYWLPGNHDDQDLMGEILQNKPFLSDKTFKMGSWHFILLNSAVKGQSSGFLTPDTIALLERELNQNPEPTVIAVHHHPIALGAGMDKMMLDNGFELLKVIKRHKQVKTVIFGHIHAVFDQYIDGVRFLGCPSTCLQLKHFPESYEIDNLPPGFRLLYFQENGTFDTEIQRIDDN